jgi:hypothetical protein
LNQCPNGVCDEIYKNCTCQEGFKYNVDSGCVPKSQCEWDVCDMNNTITVSKSGSEWLVLIVIWGIFKIILNDIGKKSKFRNSLQSILL